MSWYVVENSSFEIYYENKKLYIIKKFYVNCLINNLIFYLKNLYISR